MTDCQAHTMCRQVAEKLLLFRDGTLPEDQVQHLREHLQYCPPCLDLLRSYEEVVDVLHRLEPVGMPPGLLERMRAAMEQEIAGEGHATSDPAVD